MRSVGCMIKQTSARNMAANIVKTYAVLMKDLLSSDNCSADLRKADDTIENYRELFNGVLNTICEVSDTVDISFSEETINFVAKKFIRQARKFKWYADLKKYPKIAYELSMILFDIVMDDMKKDGVI